MTAVTVRPSMAPTTTREEALAIDVHYAERRAVLAETKEQEAIRRYHAARRNMEVYRAAMAGAENELIALRTRERELEAQNTTLLRLLGRAAGGLKPREVPREADGRRYLVIRAFRPRSRWAGKAGDLVGVREERRVPLLTLRFADGRQDDFLPAELMAL